MTQRFKRLSHSVYECKYHIVYCPKYRYRIFKGEIGEYVKQQIYQLCKQKEGLEVLELKLKNPKKLDKFSVLYKNSINKLPTQGVIIRAKDHLI